LAKLCFTLLGLAIYSFQRTSLKIWWA